MSAMMPIGMNSVNQNVLMNTVLDLEYWEAASETPFLRLSWEKSYRRWVTLHVYSVIDTITDPLHPLAHGCPFVTASCVS